MTDIQTREELLIKAERYRSALMQISSRRGKDPDYDSERSLGNYDDVFSDGTYQGEFWANSACADIADKVLKDNP